MPPPAPSEKVTPVRALEVVTRPTGEKVAVRVAALVLTEARSRGVVWSPTGTLRGCARGGRVGGWAGRAGGALRASQPAHMLESVRLIKLGRPSTAERSRGGGG